MTPHIRTTVDAKEYLIAPPGSQFEKRAGARVAIEHAPETVRRVGPPEIDTQSDYHEVPNGFEQQPGNFGIPSQ
jgi:hypothetical protein